MPHFCYTGIVPSIQPRISTVMEPALFYAIEELAKRDGVSLSQKTRDLLREAMELEEDAALEALVASRRKSKAPAISHAKLKRRLGLK